jgi:Family of unknown function (DUF6228)
MAQDNALLTIHSSNSSRTLRIRAPVNSYLTVALEGHEISGVVQVWAETGEVEGLVKFFGEMGSLEAPWKNARTWETIEGDFKLSATCSALGAVTILVSMSGLPGAAEEWQLQAGIETEFGQLVRLAAEAEALGHG